jgi:hypothetical protein
MAEETTALEVGAAELVLRIDEVDEEEMLVLVDETCQ